MSLELDPNNHSIPPSKVKLPPTLTGKVRIRGAGSIRNGNPIAEASVYLGAGALLIGTVISFALVLAQYGPPFVNNILNSLSQGK